MHAQETKNAPRPRRDAAGFPILFVVALPKCPLCVMILFNTLGVAHALHRPAFATLQLLMLGTFLALLLTRRPRPPQLTLAGAGALAVVLAALHVVTGSVAVAGAILLFTAWLTAPRKPPAACGCAELPRTSVSA